VYKKPVRVSKCSICKKAGHNKLSCPEKPASYTANDPVGEKPTNKRSLQDVDDDETVVGGDSDEDESDSSCVFDRSTKGTEETLVSEMKKILSNLNESAWKKKKFAELKKGIDDTDPDVVGRVIVETDEQLHTFKSSMKVAIENLELAVKTARNVLRHGLDQ
jgi:hypothetical protein